MSRTPARKVFVQVGEFLAWNVPERIIDGATEAVYASRMRQTGQPLERDGQTFGDRDLAWAALIGSGLLDRYATSPRPLPQVAGGEQ